MATETKQVDQSKPVTGWARCCSCDFVELKTEFKAAQIGPDDYVPICPACHSDDVVVL